MLSQNPPANPFEFASSSHLTSALFDLGDCFGNLCRLPLQSALKLFGSPAPVTHRTESTPKILYSEQPQILSPAPSRLLAHQLKTNIPFAVSREWQNQVWSYQLSLQPGATSAANQSLHQHLSARSLTSIPTEQKAHLREWVYFASPLEKLTQLDWQLLSAEEQKLQRLQNLALWFRHKLEQGCPIDNLLLVPFTDLPLGDGLNIKPAHSFARLGKLALPNQQKLSTLNFAIFRQGILTEGYGLQPSALFAAGEQLKGEALSSENQALLLLDHKQCLDYLRQLESLLS